MKSCFVAGHKGSQTVPCPNVGSWIPRNTGNWYRPLTRATTPHSSTQFCTCSYMYSWEWRKMRNWQKHRKTVRECHRCPTGCNCAAGHLPHSDTLHTGSLDVLLPNPENDCLTFVAIKMSTRRVWSIGVNRVGSEIEILVVSAARLPPWQTCSFGQWVRIQIQTEIF